MVFLPCKEHVLLKFINEIIDFIKIDLMFGL